MATAETNLGRVTFVAEGVFDPNKTDYKRLGVVVLDGSSYQATVDNPTGMPQLDGSNPDWQLIAQKGEDGQDGEDGASAYEIWLEEGNTGTISDFLLSLIGPQGEKGEMGDGLEIGASGPLSGRSAYDSEPVNFVYWATDENLFYIRANPTGWSTGQSLSSVANFLQLDDTPSSYSGSGGKAVAVKNDASGLEFVDRGVPYTGATSGVDLGSQSFSIGGEFTRGENVFDQGILGPGESSAHFRKLRDVAVLNRGNDNATEGDIVVTLPIAGNTRWVAKIIMHANHPLTVPIVMYISSYSTSNNLRYVFGQGGIDVISEVKFGRIDNNSVLIIKRSGGQTFWYGKVVISEFYHSIGYNPALSVKENYKIEFIKEEDLVGFTLNGTVTNAQFTRDPYYLDYNNFVNTPTIPAAQVNSDWDATSGVAQILNKPTTIAGFGITDAYTQNQINDFIDNKVDKVTGLQLSQESYTTIEKTKLTGIATGATANATDAQLRVRASHTGEQAISTITGLQASLDSKVTVVSGKQLSDENYTLSEKNKLASITAIFTTALKTTYDSAVSWVSTNGANVSAHLSSTSNPHGVTKAQVGLGSVDNTSDLAKPISTATQNALNNKATLGTATTEVRNNQQLDERYLQPYAVKTPTISFTLGAANKNDYLIALSNITITMPADLSTTDYPIGSTTNVRVSTGATVNFVGDGGVALDHPDGAGNMSVTGRKVVSIVRVDINAYDLIY